MRTITRHRIAALAVGTAVLAPAAIAVPAASAATKINLNVASCPSTLSGGKVTYSCTLKGTGGPAKLTTALGLKGATIIGTFTLTIGGKTHKYSVTGPIGPDKNKQVTLNGKYKGAGSGTFYTQAPANKPTAPSKIVIKGTF
jgi:hypothetical protein